jgi:hypothetical protein
LGDCYFLAALSSLAEVPERITDRFLTKVKNDSGIYAMTFFVNGIETPVIVDDFLPCYELEPSKPAFGTSSDSGELWVSLLEKGWAKLYGSYARIVAG